MHCTPPCRCPPPRCHPPPPHHQEVDALDVLAKTPGLYQLSDVLKIKVRPFGLVWLFVAGTTVTSRVPTGDNSSTLQE